MFIFVVVVVEFPLKVNAFSYIMLSASLGYNSLTLVVLFILSVAQ